MDRNAPCSSNGAQCQGMLYSHAFSVESVLTKRCVCTREGSWGILNMDCEPGKSKWLAKGKLEEMSPYEWFKLPLTLNSGTLSRICPCVCPYVLYSLPSYTLLASLLSVFVEILFCKAKGSGPFSLTTSLVARIWCFHFHAPAQFSGGKPKPCSKLLPAEATWNEHYFTDTGLIVVVVVVVLRCKMPLEFLNISLWDFFFFLPF